ncbi:MAG TPA: TraY domain-containing protein [bacterium]|nr:TraY domain-containing protein [bacterium]
MAQILVRDLEEEFVKKLKKRASRNGRSLQAEAKLILIETVNVEQWDADTALKKLDAFKKRFRGRKFVNSADLVREDRER